MYENGPRETKDDVMESEDVSTVPVILKTGLKLLLTLRRLDMGLDTLHTSSKPLGLGGNVVDDLTKPEKKSLRQISTIYLRMRICMF